MGNSGRFPRGQSRTTKPMVHAGRFSVFTLHPNLIWTTGSLTCARALMHATAHGGVRTPKKKAYTES